MKSAICPPSFKLRRRPNGNTPSGTLVELENGAFSYVFTPKCVESTSRPATIASSRFASSAKWSPVTLGETLNAGFHAQKGAFGTETDCTEVIVVADAAHHELLPLRRDLRRGRGTATKSLDLCLALEAERL